MKNNEIIDFLKTIGIILVVLGHCILTNGILSKFIYMLNLPIFFLVSGYLYKYKDEQKNNPWIFFGNKVGRFWIYYVVYGSLFVLLHNIFIRVHIIDPIHKIYTFNDIVFGILNSALFISNEPFTAAMWFIATLIISLTVFNAIIHFSQKYTKKNIVQVLLVIVFSWIGLFLSQNNINVGLNYQTSLFVQVFLFIGYTFKNREEKIINLFNNNIKKILFIIITFLLSYFILSIMNDKIDMANNQIGYPIIFYVISCTLTFDLYLIGLIIVPSISTIVKKIINIVSHNTLHIMCLHFFVFKMIDLLYYVMIRKNNIYSFPISNDRLVVLYVFLGITIPLIIFSLFKNTKVRCIKMIKNILKNEYFYYFLTFIIIAIVLNIGVLHSPYILAEDGEIYYNQLFDYGLKSIFLKYGGYLSVLSRLITCISYCYGYVFNNFILMVRTKIVICVLIESFVLLYFTKDRFALFIKNRRTRFVTSIVIELLISCFAWMFYSQTSIHWWCGLFCFFVSLELLNNKLPSFFIIIITCICLISSVSSLIIIFAIIYYVANNYKKILKDYKEAFKISLLLLFLIIQSIDILFVKEINNCVLIASHNISQILLIVKYSIKETISSFNFVFGTNFLWSTANCHLNIYTGLIIGLIILYTFIKSDNLKYYIFTIISIFALYFLIFFKSIDIEEQYFLLIGNNYHLWYNCLPAVFTTILLFVSLFNQFKIKKYKMIVIIIVLFLMTNCIEFTSHPNFETNKNLYYINDFVDYNSDKYTKVLVEPDYLGWYIYVPVNKKYCDMKGNVCYGKIEYHYKNICIISN